MRVKMKEKKDKKIRKNNNKKKFWTQKKKGFKDLSLKFPHFQENLT